MEDVFGVGKLSTNSMELIKMIYPDLAQPGVKKVGEALEIVLDLGNTILLPVKIANSKASILFKRHMETYQKNIEQIDEKEITAVHPTIGLKILDELFTVTSDEIAKLFINLLTQASTKSGAKYAHPGFVDVIKNLSEDEAIIISQIYMQNKNVKYSYLFKYDNGPVPFGDRVTNLNELVDLTFKENSLFYFDNLLRVGVINDSNLIMRGEVDEHEKIASQLDSFREEALKTLEKQQKDGKMLDVEIGIHHGRYVLNSYGKRFIECIKI